MTKKNAPKSTKKIPAASKLTPEQVAAITGGGACIGSTTCAAGSRNCENGVTNACEAEFSLSADVEME